MSGTRLTIYADIISDRKNWDKASMGFIFLALVTQLPEIVTNITGTLHGNGELVLNAMFGGMTMQTAVFAIADIFVIGSMTLSYAARKPINLLQGVVLILLLSFVLVATMIGDTVAFWHIRLSPILPELSASIAAVRLCAQSMAISNIFGSNLIMIFLLLPADMFYFQGAILNSANDSAKFALISGIVVTAVYVIGLIVRKSKHI